MNLDISPVTNNKISALQKEVKENLLTNILPFWMKAIDQEHGGFTGRINGRGEVVPKSDKGSVLNTRILWTFSAAYRALQDPALLACATRAKDYLLNYFYDQEHGGIYWMLDYLGQPVDRKKQVYAQGFAIYGLSEYYLATKDTEALDAAIRIYNDIEKYSYDHELDGYLEAFSFDWKELEDMRLSAKDANEKKTMNTHLHILEPYTNLYRAWPDDRLKMKIEKLVDVFLNKILDRNTGHLNLFFNERWQNQYDIISYGHDIEASWLLHEAAGVINSDKLELVEKTAVRIAQAAAEGVQPDGSLVYELDKSTGHCDADRHWWVQAEAVVGFLNTFCITGNELYLNYALNCWEYIKTHLVDKKAGEWYWSILADGTTNVEQDKLGIWKCPYHNSRMCLEVMKRG